MAGTPETVLIVDDSLTVRMDLKEAFEGVAFRTLICASAQDARVAVCRDAVDVIVLDVMLPDGDGVDLLAELREHPNTRKAVVVMLSSESKVKDRMRALRTGADEYVGKPYDAHYVVAKARKLLRGRNSETTRDGARNRPLILIVDDSVTFRETLRQACEQAGHTVMMASSGEDGLRIAADERPDAVVIDSVLPGIDGATVIRRLRLDAALRATPCLLLTGSDDRDAELRALDAGADAFVRKFEDVEIILARLGAVLRSAATGMPEVPASALGPQRILALDDSATYLNELAGELRDEGYDVVPARTIKEAIELLAVQEMDCLLLDLLLPEGSGLELCRHLKETPILRDIPLIIMSAGEERSTMLDALEAGADDFVNKSSGFDVLKARVRAQIRRKQYEDENRRARMDLINKEREAAEARAARALANSRAELLAALEQKHHALEAVHAELAQANEAKTDFLHTMSHELRTPLNAIIGFSELMTSGMVGDLEPRHREFVRHVYESGMHLLELVNDILDLSKIEAGKVDIDPESIDLDSFLHDCVTVIQERAQTRRILVEVEGAGQRDPLRADRRRFKQILYNLLSNAVKFTHEGGKIRVVAKVVDRAQAASGMPGFATGLRSALPDSAFAHFAQISVTDSGIGISQENLGTLFKPFSQIKNAHTQKIEGTGLGLVTVMRLAQLHCGAVAVTSEQGSGSCFTTWIPWTVGEPLASGATPAQEADIEIPLALLVEDDERAATIMRVQLESLGFRVRHAHSAEEALRLVDECKPELITLDINLPGMDGWDFLSRVKGVQAWSEIPVVVVSVAANHEVGISLGAASILQKPVNRRKLALELSRLGIVPSPNRDVTILVVDDDPNAMELMCTYLNQPGYSILRANGGREGIDMIRKHRPDLVVLDLVMPEVNGIAVVDALKQDASTASIPVVIVTSKHLTNEDRLQLDSHILGVIDKADLQKDRFVSEVKRAFGRAPRELQAARQRAAG